MWESNKEIFKKNEMFAVLYESGTLSLTLNKKHKSN
jgi:hypothetical protein